MATVSLTSFPASEQAYCPKCDTPITLYDPKGSEFCVCSACYSYIRFEKDEPEKLKTLTKPKLKPTLPLGTEGKLNDVLFKVIGYIEKDEYDVRYTWREYVLYNYEKGYATLSEFDGHWNLVYGKNFLPKLEKPLDGKTYVMYDDVEYKLFHKYGADVKAILGEFDWDVFNEDVNIREFIAPPFILSKEESNVGGKKETNYYRGEYLELNAIAAAFNLDVNLFPSRVGILSNQPSRAYETWNWAFKTSILLLLAMLAIELIVVSFKPSEVLMDSLFNLASAPEKGSSEFQPIKSSAFKVSDVSTSLEIELSSGVENNWLEATIVLVNEKTNQTWEVTKGIEYYYGYESGERWSEGNQKGSVLLSEIPGGIYHLNIYPASGDAARDYINVKIESNGTLWQNVLVCAGLFSILPIVSFYNMRNFERKRWSNSDYSPFEQ